MIIFKRVTQYINSIAIFLIKIRMRLMISIIKYISQKNTTMYHLKDYKKGEVYRAILRHFGGCKSCAALRNLQLISDRQRYLYKKVSFEAQIRAAARQMKH